MGTKFTAAEEYARINDARSQKEVIKNHYLHSFGSNYEKVYKNNPLSRKSVLTESHFKKIDKILQNIIANQERDENLILEYFDCGHDEMLLNKKIKENTSLDDLFNITNSKRKFGIDLYKLVKEVLEEDIDVTTEEFCKKLSIKIKNELMMKIKFNDKPIKKTSNFSKKINDEIDRITRFLSNGWDEAIIDKNINKIVKVLHSNISGSLGEIILTQAINNLDGEDLFRVTGAEKNELNKSIKSDISGIIQLGEIELNSGFQVKNYVGSVQKTDDGKLSLKADVSIHSRSKLTTLYDNLVNYEEAGPFKDIVTDIIKNFEDDLFIYHLVNQAAYHRMAFNSTGGAVIKENDSEKDAASMLTDFINKLLPYYMGSGVLSTLKEGENSNVYFYILQDQIIRSSDIMKAALNNETKGRLSKAKMHKSGIYNNFDYDENLFRKEKMNAIQKNNLKGYSRGVIEIGRQYGDTLYNNIGVGTIHLDLVLKELI